MMRIRQLLAALAILVGMQAGAQSLPAGDDSPALRGQGITTHRFLDLLERGATEDALKLLAPGCLRGQKGLPQSFASWHKELRGYLDSTHRFVVIIWPEKFYNTFRCRYSNTNGDFFYIDLYFREGDPAAPIARLNKLPARKLASERAALAKRRVDEARQGPPVPPPFPPPGVQVRRVKSKG